MLIWIGRASWSRGHLHRSQVKYFKIQDFAHGKDIGLKQLFLETRMLLILIMSGNVKSPAEGLKDSECEQGAIATRPPIPYVAPVDPYRKKGKDRDQDKAP